MKNYSICTIANIDRAKVNTMSSAVKKKSTKRNLKNLSVSTYKKDFYKWISNQSELLKRGDYSKLDIENLVEEIESLGISERRALESYLKVLILHLLKIKYQPDYRTRSWDNSVKASRYQINKLLERSPSLNKEKPEILEDAYYLARLKAVDETSMNESTFPDLCPWTFIECMTDAGLPTEQDKEKRKKSG